MALAPSDTLLRFAHFELHPAERVLRVRGEPVALGSRAFDLLLVLAQRHERLVAKQELLDLVWPGLVVEEHNVATQVSTLRKLLGAQAIATVPGRGYRLTLAVQRNGEPDAAAPQPGTGQRTRLPLHLTPLIGRDAEQQALSELLAQHRLVTLVGTGGIGKTLLAMHVLRQEQGRHEHGECWVDLASLGASELIAPSVAAALGLPALGEDPVAALAAAAAPLALLLALDNAEAHAGAVAALAQALLDRCAGLQLIVTSQVPLALREEQLFRVGPLALPADDVPAKVAFESAALRLLAERVRQHDGTADALSSPLAHLGPMLSICRALDGNPLAIELAAARVPLLGLAGVATSLDQRLQWLTKAGADRPPRQRSLRAALEWSHGLLDTDARIVFRRLAVFAGGGTLALILDVVADAELPRWRAVNALDALLERSLVRLHEGEDSAAVPRYRLLESPLALAHEQLAASGEDAALRERHARVLHRHLVERHEEVLAGGLRYDAYATLLEPDLDNARAALAWAVGHEPALAASMVRPLFQALSSDRYAEVLRMFETTEPLIPQAPATAQMHWALTAATFFSNRHPARSWQWTQRTIALARRLGDQRILYRALGLMALLRLPQLQQEQRAALAEMAEIEREDWPAGALMGRAMAQALFAYHAGDLEGIEAPLRRWLAMAEQAGSQTNIAAAQTNLADLALARGDAAEAVRLNLALDARWHGSRRLRNLASVRHNLCSAWLAAGDVKQARAAAEAGWPISDAFDMKLYWAATLALLAALEGRPRCAAMLVAACEARLAARGETLEHNELRNLERAREIAAAALERAAIDAALREGAQLADEAIGRIGLASDD